VKLPESVFEENVRCIAVPVSIKNPRTDATWWSRLVMLLNDARRATSPAVRLVSWNGYITRPSSIPANTTAVCSYTVLPTGRTATLNTATVKLNALTANRYGKRGLDGNVIRSSATLDVDDQNPACPALTITDGAEL